MAGSKKRLRTFVAEAVRRLLPDPIREEATAQGTTLRAGDPALVAVNLTEEGVAVSVCGVRWDGPHTPVPDDFPLAQVAWSQLGGNEAEAVVAVNLLIQAATVIRRTAFRRCRYCQENKPPEWQHEDDVCQSCAEKHLGVVH